MEVANHLFERNRISKEREDIGKGSFGIVYKATDLKTNKIIAVKQIQFNDPKLFLREVGIMAKINYPSILPFLGCCLSQDPNTRPHLIITEYMPNKSLDTYINQAIKGDELPNWGPTEKTIQMIGIAAAMRYLHRNNILHRDLKPANVLLNKNLEPFVCDFGLSKYVEDVNAATDQTVNVGTPVFMAPEEYTSKYYNKLVDVYAYGILLYNLLTLRRPFDGETCHSIFVKVSQGYRPEFPEGFSPLYTELIEQCWAQDPKTRPTFDMIFNVLETEKFYLPGSDFQKVHAYIDKLQKAEKKIVEDYKNDIDMLERQILQLKSQQITSECKFGAGIAQTLNENRTNLFENKYIYSRSSFDIHYCLGDNATGFFGMSSKRLFIQFDFKEPVTIQGLKITSYDDSFKSNWKLISYDENGVETMVYRCLNHLENGRSISTGLKPFRASSVRIEKTGEPDTLSIKTIEFFDSQGPIFQRMLEEYHLFNIPVIITSTNYFPNTLFNPASEIEVFTYTGKDNWIQLALETPIQIRGYRIKRDPQNKMHGWSIIASADAKKWVELDKCHEETPGEFGRLIEKEVKAEQPFKLFRIVPETQTWEKSRVCGCICHFDVFA